MSPALIVQHASELKSIEIHKKAVQYRRDTSGLQQSIIESANDASQGELQDQVRAEYLRRARESILDNVFDESYDGYG